MNRHKLQGARLEQLYKDARVMTIGQLAKKYSVSKRTITRYLGKRLKKLIKSNWSLQAAYKDVFGIEQDVRTMEYEPEK